MNIRKSELYGSLAERDPRWYVAAIIAGMEATAVEHLHRQGFVPYVPMMIDRGLDDRGKRTETRRPRFKGYGFVSLDLDLDQWRSVNGTRGVRHLLPLHLERPVALPNGFVEKLMAQPEKAEEIIIEFAVDDLVRFIAGPLVSYMARVDSQNGERLRSRLSTGVVVETTTAMVERA